MRVDGTPHRHDLRVKVGSARTDMIAATTGGGAGLVVSLVAVWLR